MRWEIILRYWDSACQPTSTSLKDTPHNIRETGEFVVNFVDEAPAEAMNLTSIDAPPEIDDAWLAGLQLAPSEGIAPPRIARAAVSFECRTLHFIETGPHQVTILGEVLHAHVLDQLVTDRSAAKSSRSATADAIANFRAVRHH